jgi:calcium/calmodulin-dependent protein kinase I
MHTSIILENNISGYLRRQAKSALGAGLHRKRFYRLDGSVLSKQAAEASPATWHANILGASVTQHSKLCFSIALQDPSADSGEGSRLVLYARVEEQCQKWVQCLHSAATRTLEAHYRIGEVIGEGGFASVRLGQCRSTGRIVAVKSMRKEQEFMQLYGREIAVIKRVDHSNIVRTFDLFETDKKIHIVMEYMKGGMLFEAIADGVAFPEVDVAQLLREILHGIMYLHDNGIVHRDIKPENVLCTDAQPPWHVKIADFGLSKFTEKGDPSADVLMKTMIGTPEFIAPEVARHENYTSKVDIWAVGMLMYNVVTGRLPFEDNEEDFAGKLRMGLQLTFPEEQWERYSPEARLFTKALLCPVPERRLTALGALVHPWLDDERRFGSSRFAAHGRFSSKMLGPAGEGDALAAAGKATGRKSYFFGAARKRKPSWLVSFIAVRAACRLMQLVRPHRSAKDAPAAAAAAKDVGHVSAAAGTEFDLSEDDDSDVSPTSVNAFSPSVEAGGDSPPSSRNLGSLMRSLHHHTNSSGPPGPDAAPLSPRDGPASAAKRLGLPPRTGSGLMSGPLRKASGLAAGLLGGKAPAGPARKGSLRRFLPSGGKGGADAGGTASSPLASPLATSAVAASAHSNPQSAAVPSAATAAQDLDVMLGLGDLGLQAVDDGAGDASCDDDSVDGGDGPSSLHSKKHMIMLREVGLSAPGPPQQSASPTDQRRKSTLAGRAPQGYVRRLQEVSTLNSSSVQKKRMKGGPPASGRGESRLVDRPGDE